MVSGDSSPHMVSKVEERSAFGLVDPIAWVLVGGKYSVSSLAVGPDFFRLGFPLFRVLCFSCMCLCMPALVL